MELSEIARSAPLKSHRSRAPAASQTRRRRTRRRRSAVRRVRRRRRRRAALLRRLRRPSPHVNDPAARYLSQAAPGHGRSQGRQSSRRGAGRPLTRHRPWLCVIALIPVAAAIGVIAGRSSNNDDSQLIQALEQRQAAATHRRRPHRDAARRRRRPRRRCPPAAQATSQPASRATKSAGKAVSTTQYGSVAADHRLQGRPGRRSSRARQATQQVQKSTGKNYVNGQSSLPSQVVVP